MYELRHLFIVFAMVVVLAMHFGCSQENKFRSPNDGATNTPLEQEAAQEVEEPAVDEVPEKLKIKAFIGAETLSSDACKNPPTTHSRVATKLLPIDYCLTGDSANEPTTKICVLVNDTETIPAADHACWEKKENFEKVVLLNQGANYVRIFARDASGYMTSDGGRVILNQGKPPYIDILLPNLQDLAYKFWKVGDVYKIKWRVTDDDTKFADLRVIVSIIDPVNKKSFKHLACNFKNSARWKQCPEASIEESALISGDVATDTFELSLKVPPEFDETKKYVIAISAIDQSGNASIASTQEINAGVEVLAGRSYKGLGGSGVTIQTDVFGGNVYVDNRKTIYLPSSNLKIDPFDSRTCRMFRASETDITPYDCRDAFYHGFVSIYPMWTYDPQRDVFFAKAIRRDGAVNVPYLVKIDFKAKSIQPIFGGLNKTALSDQVPQNYVDSANRFW